MRVVGGKIGPDGGLSAFITFVQSGGPADLASISEGMYIIYIFIIIYNITNTAIFISIFLAWLSRDVCSQFLYVYVFLINLGDQILEWDGSSLNEATFEEAQQILNKSGDTVQLVVVRTRLADPLKIWYT